MNTLEQGIKTLHIYSKYFDIWSLAGNSRASCRAHVMADLLGLPKIAQSKAGIAAIRAEFYKQAGLDITGKCLAELDEDFMQLCIKVTEH